MALKRELETYQKNLASLLADKGKYVLIHGDAVDSIWPTYEAALTAGYERFEFKPFLVKQIQEEERSQFFPRALPHRGPSRTVL